ncbi:MAG TPA: hypothetical protein VII13_00805 [Vicinamibacteria bacterium]
MRALPLLVAAALAVLVPRAQDELDRLRAQDARERAVLYVRSGDRLRRLAPGFRSLLADLYWLRTVQYYGAQIAYSKEKKFELLQPLVTITTRLDPRFELAYRYGATFLAEPPPRGAGQPEAAVALLERGARALPDSWRVRQDLGFSHFFYLDDAATASRVLLDASRIPGAPYWLVTLAAELLRRGGERETSRLLWQQIYEQADEAPIKENARMHVLQIEAADTADAIGRAVEEFARQRGRRPASLPELKASGWPDLPLYDPGATPFEYDPATGQVAVSRRSPVWAPGYARRPERSPIRPAPSAAPVTASPQPTAHGR